jgi:hypothetical protein
MLFIIVLRGRFAMMNHKLYEHETRKSRCIAHERSALKLSLDGNMVNEALPNIVAKIERIVFDLYHQCNYNTEGSDVSVAMFRKVNHLRDEIEILRLLIASSSALKKEKGIRGINYTTSTTLLFASAFTSI